MSPDHPLAAILLDAANGRFTSQVQPLRILPALEHLPGAVFSFPGYTVITADLDAGEVRAHLPSNDPGAPMNPVFLAWLAERLHSRTYTPDAVLAAFPADPSTASPLIERPDLLTHPRAVMAQMFRRDVRAYSDASGDGLLTIGRGVCDRIEVSVEVEPTLRNRGLGRRLALAARAMVPGDEPVFAQVSPGNAASLRAFLAAGYTPIGAEVAFVRRPS